MKSIGNIIVSVSTIFLFSAVLDRPDVLMEGDSVSRKSVNRVGLLLGSEANVVPYGENGGSSSMVIESIGKKLRENQYEYVYFNCGIWDLDTVEKKPGVYKSNLSRIVDTIRTYGARPVWCNTTPRSADSVGYSPRTRLANKYAKEVMDSLNVWIIDVANCLSWEEHKSYQIDGTHYSAEGLDTLGGRIAADFKLLLKPFSIIADTLATGTEGQYYSEVVHWSGKSEETTVELKNGQLPPGIVLSKNRICGIPQSSGVFALDFLAKNGSLTAEKKITLRIRDASASKPEIITKQLPTGYLNIPYTGNVEIAGGYGTVHIQKVGGNLPNGMGINSDGEVYGKPSESGSFEFKTIAVDENNDSSQTISINVIIKNNSKDTIEINPTHDAIVRNDQVNSNFGLESTAIISKGHSFFMVFDLWPISGAINNSQLQICVNVKPLKPVTIYLYKVKNTFLSSNSEWTEESITKSNAPMLDTMLTQFLISEKGYQGVDVTKLLKVFLGTGHISFAMATDGTDSIIINTINSKVNMPRLLVEQEFSPLEIQKRPIYQLLQKSQNTKDIYMYTLSGRRIRTENRSINGCLAKQINLKYNKSYLNLQVR